MAEKGLWERFHISSLLSWSAPCKERTIFILKLTQWSIQKLNFNSIKASLPVGHAFVAVIVSRCFSDWSSLNMNCTGAQTFSRARGDILIQPHRGKRNHDRAAGRSGFECLQRVVPNTHIEREQEHMHTHGRRKESETMQIFELMNFWISALAPVMVMSLFWHKLIEGRGNEQIVCAHTDMRTHTHTDLSPTQSPADSSLSHLFNLSLPSCLLSLQPAILRGVTCINLLAHVNRTTKNKSWEQLL